MCSARRFTRYASSGAALLAGVTAAWLAGCQTPPERDAEAVAAAVAATVRQQQQIAYADLAAGRFVSLADFETPGQEAGFRTVGAGGGTGTRPQPVVSDFRARAETGALALRVELPQRDDRLVFSGPSAELRGGVRDWRPYGLLLMSIFGPEEGAALEFTVESGAPLPMRWSRTLILEPGWNLIRLDLGSIGDEIDLGDVRTLNWRAPQAASALTFYLDDLLLVDDARILVEPTSDPEQLYVFRRGRRIHVGAPGRFELAFVDGLIVNWRDPTSENLADIGGLGPWPVPLPVDWLGTPGPPVVYDDPALYASWGSQVVSTQRIAEASAFRAVIEGRWRFADVAAGQPATPLAEDAPEHLWRYVVYPSGRVHVRVISRAGSAGWSALRVGYVLGLNGRAHFKVSAAVTGEAHARPVPCVLAARLPRRAADLLWTWPRDTGLGQLRQLVSDDGRRLAVLVGDVPAEAVVDVVHLLQVWPPEMDSLRAAQPAAADYQTPAPLWPSAGTLRTDIAGDRDGDGFNEAEGCYELGLAGDLLRLDFDPRPLLRSSPVLRVHGAAGRRHWVYVRGRPVRTVALDADGNLVVHLGELLSRPAAVEVHTAAEAGP